jgi:hypothetical protein
MEKIKFEAKTDNESVSMTLDDTNLPNLCDFFQRFLVASGYTYVDYKRLAKEFKALERNGGPT